MEPGLAALAGVFRHLVPVLIVTSLCSGVAGAQDWPTRAIRAIVPLTAGSATDMIGRTVLDQLSQQTRPADRGGESPGRRQHHRHGHRGAIGRRRLYPSDQLVVAYHRAGHVRQPAVRHLARLHAGDPARQHADGSRGLAVEGLQELGRLRRRREGEARIDELFHRRRGNFSHFASEVFRRAAGFQAVHVASKGAPEALMEVLADRVDFSLRR